MIRRSAPEPTDNEPRVPVKDVPEVVRVPCEVFIETTVAAAGKLPFTMTPPAELGPRLVTVIE